MTGRVALRIEPVAADDTRRSFGGTLTLVDPDAPVFGLAEVSGWRGDGVFESVSVVDGRAAQCDAHIARLVRSARLSDLPEPNAAQWRRAVTEAAAACGPGQWAMKLVLWRPPARGVSGGAAEAGVATRTPVAWITAVPAPDHTRARRDGVRVITLDRGLDSGVAARAPWLLRGAKTFSYAVNTAAMREARRRGADEVLFVSSDGVVLEGATSSVVLRVHGRYVSPAADAGVLPGTTQQALFAHLSGQGADAAVETVHVTTLASVDAAWLVSSVRLAVPVVSIDGRGVPIDGETTASFNRFLLNPDR